MRFWAWDGGLGAHSCCLATGIHNSSDIIVKECMLSEEEGWQVPGAYPMPRLVGQNSPPDANGSQGNGVSLKNHFLATNIIHHLKKVFISRFYSLSWFPFTTQWNRELYYIEYCVYETVHYHWQRWRGC